CLNPPETYDAKEDTQKALSCIYRLHEGFGMKHVIDVLRGADSERIRSMRHNELSTYAIGSDKNNEQWSSIFRQLIHRGAIFQDIANYSVLKLTASSLPLLKGEVEIALAKPPLRVKKKGKQAGKAKSKYRDIPHDEELFEKLRVLRKGMADKLDVPPYIIFGDATLINMAQSKPTTDEAFLEVSGVGQVKLDRFGDKFLKVIADHGA
ncbi:MAG: RQC domain-containing protein, partial [Ghiorsea sp.]